MKTKSVANFTLIGASVW